jgi:elongation factor Ts
MAAITAAMVKELRETSGAGMMDCKKALAETDGNMEAALDILKKNGQAKADKKANRIAAEGVCRIAIEDNKKAAVVEVNSETDFVAKNEKFTSYVERVAEQALKSNSADMDAFMAEQWVDDASKTVKDSLVEMIAVIGEKLSIRRFDKLEGDAVVGYLHGAGRIGVLVSADTATVNDAVLEALRNVAMQIAAMNPQYLSDADISDEEKAKMREITIDSALNDPASLPKPLLQKLIDKAIADKKWSDEDIAVYEEKKSNMNYLFNFLSKEAAQTLAELALADKDAIVADKIFAGLVNGRISKQEKEVVLLNQVYVKAEDGKQTVAQYLAQVGKDNGTTVSVKKFIRFETGEGMEKKNEDFAAEVAAQMNA